MSSPCQCQSNQAMASQVVGRGDLCGRRALRLDHLKIDCHRAVVAALPSVVGCVRDACGHGRKPRLRAARGRPREHVVDAVARPVLRARVPTKAARSTSHRAALPLLRHQRARIGRRASRASARAGRSPQSRRCAGSPRSHLSPHRRWEIPSRAARCAARAAPTAPESSLPASAFRSPSSSSCDAVVGLLAAGAGSIARSTCLA